jgi:TonB family protein
MPRSKNGGEGAPGDLWSPSASERLRSRWNARVRWSTLLAAALHVLVFAASPVWRTGPLESERREVAGRPLVQLPATLQLPGSGEGTPGAVRRVAIEGEGEAGSEGDAEDRLGRADRGMAELWDALGARTLGREPLRPALAETVPAPVRAQQQSREAEGAASEDGLTISGRAATADLTLLPEPDSIDLSRLNALRPELAFVSASAWVLIRNQPEVEAFLRGAYRQGRLDPSAAGTVGITLWIDRRGSVEWAEISQSSGRRDLDEFALALFNDVASFRPAREQGVAVSRSVTFSVNFPW